MLTKFKLLAFILIVCTLFITGQQDTLPPSLSSPQEDALFFGMDVSQFQGEIDWDQVRQNETKIPFVFVKATESIGLVDPQFEKNWTGAKQAGILRGAYHFFDAEADAKAQAELFINTVKTLEENDLPPWLDLESDKFDKVDEVSCKNFIDSVFIWLDTVENGLGAKPIIYANPDFAEDYLTDPRFSRYALAVAQYDDGSGSPGLLGAWEGKTWTFWQYSPDGIVKGISEKVDQDRFNGSAQDLLDFIKNSRKKEIEVTLTADESKEPPAVEEKKETPAQTEPETPISKEEIKALPETEPGTPTVETTRFSDEINLGKIRFPRDFIHKNTDHEKGVYQVKLITKEKEETPSFQVYDNENKLLFEEMALVIPRKAKFGKFKYRISKRLLGNEYFMIRVTEPDKHIYAFFLIKK